MKIAINLKEVELHGTNSSTNIYLFNLLVTDWLIYETNR